MTAGSEDTLVALDIIEPLEVLIFEAIGMTTIALARAATGELTLPQWRALVVIGRTEHVRVGDVASSVGMSLPSASRLVQRLERRGLVATSRDESDRRATLVRMTPGGRDLRERVVACRRQLMAEALAAHAPTLPRDLTAGLKAVVAAFDQYA